MSRLFYDFELGPNLQLQQWEWQAPGQPGPAGLRQVRKTVSGGILINGISAFWQLLLSQERKG